MHTAVSAMTIRRFFAMIWMVSETLGIHLKLRPRCDNSLLGRGREHLG